MVEVFTYWRGDLVDVRRCALPPDAPKNDPFTYVVRRADPPQLLVGAGPDWGFWRILTILAVVYSVALFSFALTPNPKVLYLLDESLGSMALPSGPEGAAGYGKLYAVRPHLPSSLDATPTAKRTGPLLKSPPGSRTFQAPPMMEPAPYAMLGMLSESSHVESILSDSVFASGLESGDRYGAGGLGLSGIGSGGGGNRSLTGNMVGGVVGVGGGGRAEGIGYGTIGTIGGIGTGRLSRRHRDKPTEDVIIRSTKCREVVEIVRRAAAELEKPIVDPPSRAHLLRVCKYRAAPSAMTCIAKASDNGDDLGGLLKRCGDKLPKAFLRALGVGQAVP